MLSKLILYTLNLFILIGSSAPLLRNKRYLVYPDGGPARAQFILGLGIPVDLKEQSVTVGTVIKFQYDLPTNSTEYTSRIYGFANTITSRRDFMDVNKDDDDSVNTVIPKRTSTDLVNEDITHVNDVMSKNTSDEITDEETTTDNLEEDNNTLVDLVFDNEHKLNKRAIAFMEGGTGNDVVDVKYKESLEEAIRRQEKLDQEYRTQEPEIRRTNRWDLYKVMQKMMERYGFSGRPCMLRTICEAAEVPFTHKNGLLGEMVHILFTPSTTKDQLSHHTDNEYHAAERLGRELGTDCETLFPECEASLLETFTQVGINTLHKFGFNIK